jgi:hypothetical protein
MGSRNPGWSNPGRGQNPTIGSCQEARAEGDLARPLRGSRGAGRIGPGSGDPRRPGFRPVGPGPRARPARDRAGAPRASGRPRIRGRSTSRGTGRCDSGGPPTCRTTNRPAEHPAGPTIRSGVGPGAEVVLQSGVGQPTWRARDPLRIRPVITPIRESVGLSRLMPGPGGSDGVGRESPTDVTDRELDLTGPELADQPKRPRGHRRGRPVSIVCMQSCVPDAQIPMPLYNPSLSVY